MFFFRKRLKKSTPEEEKAFRERMQEEKLGFKDTWAMILSALLVLVLPCLLVLLVLSGLAMLILGIF